MYIYTYIALLTPVYGLILYSTVVICSNHRNTMFEGLITIEGGATYCTNTRFPTNNPVKLMIMKY